MTSKRIDVDAIDIAFLKDEFARFRAGLDQAKNRLGDNAHDALEQISAYLDGHGFAARVSSVEDQVADLSSKLKDKGQDALGRLETEVTARPLTSMALAFGVGLLAAQLLRRR